MFGYDLKQAATYFLQDDKKIAKIAFLYVLAIAYIVLNHAKHFSPYYILLIIPYLYFVGYFAKNNNSRILKKENKLPELSDWKNYLIIGFKNIVGFTIYAVACILIVGIIGIFLSLISLIPIFSNVVPTMKAAMPFVTVSGGIIAGILILLTTFCAQIAFSVNLKLKSFFDFKLIKQILFTNHKLFLRLLLVMIVVGLLNIIIVVILSITIIGVVLIPFAEIYLCMIVSDLYGQFISKSTQVNEG